MCGSGSGTPTVGVSKELQWVVSKELQWVVSKEVSKEAARPPPGAWEHLQLARCRQRGTQRAIRSQPSRRRVSAVVRFLARVGYAVHDERGYAAKVVEAMAA